LASVRTLNFQELIQRAQAALIANQSDDALRCLDAALLLRPHDAHVLNTKGTVLGRLARFDEATATFERAARYRPQDASVQYNIAFALQCQERFTEALTAYDRAIRLRSQYPEALSNRGLTLGSLGRYAEAVASLESALRLRPHDPVTLNNLGHVYFKLQRFDLARRCFEEATRVAPNYLDALSNLGRTLVLLDEPEGAIHQFKRALAIDPGFAEAVEGIAVAYRTQDLCNTLVTVCRELVARAPSSSHAWLELGASLVTVNRLAEAEQCFSKATQLDPLSATVHGRIGRALLEAGDLDGATNAFERACNLRPRSTHYLESLVRLKNASAENGMLTRLTDMLPIEHTLEPYERVNLHFALGKAYSDVGDNDRSFSHYCTGNEIQRSRIDYEEARVLSAMTLTVELFNPLLVQRCRSGGRGSSMPIFIMGMPRTGSTLVEQILAAHKRTIALGELKCFNEAIQALDAKKGGHFPGWLASLAPGDVSFLADEYLSRLLKTAHMRDVRVEDSDALRLVDKMPGNFHHAGLIHLALPNAKIIHTRRDPIETCLSCFQVLFEAAPYSYNLGELGRYYRRYERLMSTWRATLPAGAILDIDYEALVTDFENTARQIVSFCGLEWDDSCLAFHRVARPVRTASAAQVRRPLYNSSVKKRHAAEGRLRPLIEGLATA
jgi:tetratricopeptide (TPR) repeat protein